METDELEDMPLTADAPVLFYSDRRYNRPCNLGHHPGINSERFCLELLGSLHAPGQQYPFMNE